MSLRYDVWILVKRFNTAITLKLNAGKIPIVLDICIIINVRKTARVRFFVHQK